jgi:hypothetical protein
MLSAIAWLRQLSPEGPWEDRLKTGAERPCLRPHELGTLENRLAPPRLLERRCYNNYTMTPTFRKGFLLPPERDFLNTKS